MSDFLPNAYQTPNAYVDRLLHLLTAEEWKVLSYLIRRILGFNKRQDYVSSAQFSRGKKSYKGHSLDHGTGLGEGAVRTALDALVRYRLVIVLEYAQPARQLPPLYSLQLDSDLVDYRGLEERHSEKLDEARKKTAKARAVLRSRVGPEREEQSLFDKVDETDDEVAGSQVPARAEKADATLALDFDLDDWDSVFGRE